MKLSTLMLFAEALDQEGGKEKDIKAKQYVAKAGMRFLKILDKVGKLEDE